MAKTICATSHTEDNGISLASPTVGRVLLTVGEGDLVAPGGAFGLFEQFGVERKLLAPSGGTALAVTRSLVGQGWQSVGFHTPLLALTPAGDGPVHVASSTAASEVEGLPAGAVPVPAPVEGQVYLAAGPNEPRFVQEGDIIELGAVVGLIEVMKFFYEVTFDLEGWSGAARVVKIAAQDAAPVESNDPIIYVEPVAP